MPPKLSSSAMTRGRKYPLDLLARLRVKQVDDATRLLSEAIRAREAAEHGAAVVIARREASAEQTRAVGERERRALDRGELRAEDLAHADAWSVRVEAERVDLERRLAKAMEATHAAHEQESDAQGGVARARASSDVVSRDRTRWEDARQKRANLAEEEAGAEAFRPKPT